MEEPVFNQGGSDETFPDDMLGCRESPMRWEAKPDVSSAVGSVDQITGISLVVVFELRHEMAGGWREQHPIDHVLVLEGFGAVRKEKVE